MMRHELEILRVGNASADALLLIHGVNPISPKAPFVADLARTRNVIAPSHPGFGASPLPPDFDTMYDLTNLYLDVLDNLPGDEIAVAGFGFGGWGRGGRRVARQPPHPNPGPGSSGPPQ